MAFQGNLSFFGREPAPEATQQQLDPSANPMLVKPTRQVQSQSVAPKADTGGLMGMSKSQMMGASAAGKIGTALALGASIPTAAFTAGIGGVVGAVATEIASDIFGFGKEKTPKFMLATNGLGTSADKFEDGYMVQSKLGTIGLSDSGSKYVKASDPNFQKVVDGVARFDNVIAEYIGPDGIGEIQTLLSKPMGDSNYGWQATFGERDLMGRWQWMLGAAANSSDKAKNALSLLESTQEEFRKARPALWNQGEEAVRDAKAKAKEQVSPEDWAAYEKLSDPQYRVDGMDKNYDYEGVQRDQAAYERVANLIEQSTGAGDPDSAYESYRKKGGTFSREAFDAMIFPHKGEWGMDSFVKTTIAGLQGYNMDNLQNGTVPENSDSPFAADPSSRVGTVSGVSKRETEKQSRIAKEGGMLGYLRSIAPKGMGEQLVESAVGYKPTTPLPGDIKEPPLPNGYFARYLHYKAQNTGGLK